MNQIQSIDISVPEAKIPETRTSVGFCLVLTLHRMPRAKSMSNMFHILLKAVFSCVQCLISAYFFVDFAHNWPSPAPKIHNNIFMMGCAACALCCVAGGDVHQSKTPFKGGSVNFFFLSGAIAQLS